MSFSLKPQNKSSGSSESNIDYQAIADQVEGGPNAGVISLIVDMGIQDRDMACSTDGKSTTVATQDEADDLVDQAAELGAKDVTYTQTDKGFVVACNIYKPKDAQEVIIFADFPDTVIDYGDKIGKLPYRQMLNSSFKGVIKGFALNPAPPTAPSTLWTFAGSSKLTKLANATKQVQIIGKDKDGNDLPNGGDDNMDIGQLLGQPLLIDLQKKKAFINAKGFMSLMKGMPAPELPFEPVGLSFDNATVELLEAAKLRKGVIDKIKTAKNYEGSAMETAVEEYSKRFSGGSSSGNAAAATTEPKKPVNVQVEAADKDDENEIPF